MAIAQALLALLLAAPAPPVADPAIEPSLARAARHLAARLEAAAAPAPASISPPPAAPPAATPPGAPPSPTPSPPPPGRAAELVRWRTRQRALGGDPSAEPAAIAAAFEAAFEAAAGTPGWPAPGAGPAGGPPAVPGEDRLGAELARVAGPPLAAAYRELRARPAVALVRASGSCGPRGGRAEVVLASLPAISRHRLPHALPVCVRAGSGDREATACGLVTRARGEIALPFCPGWLWPDAGGVGFLVADLAPLDLPALARRLPPPEALALATDADLLARIGRLPAQAIVDLVPALAAGADPLLTLASLELATLAQPEQLAGAPAAGWAVLVRRAWGARARALGWLPRPDDDEDARALRAALLPLVAGDGGEAVLAGEAQALARRWLGDPTQVPAEIAWPALRAAAVHGDGTLFDLVVDVTRRTADPEERAGLFGVLGAFADPPLHRAALALAVADGTDPRAAGALLAAGLSRRTTRDAALDLVAARWKTLAARWPAEELARLAAAAAAGACDPAAREGVEARLGRRVAGSPAAARAFARGLAEADGCAALHARLGAGFARALARLAPGRRGAP